MTKTPWPKISFTLSPKVAAELDRWAFAELAKHDRGRTRLHLSRSAAAARLVSHTLREWHKAKEKKIKAD